MNEPGDFYRFLDATRHAEFLYGCVKKTIEEDLPREAGFLARYDQFRTLIAAIVDMPDSNVDLLFRLLQQKGGRFSKRGREGEFRKLTQTEFAAAEGLMPRRFGKADQELVAG